MEFVSWLRSHGFDAAGELPLDGAVHRIDRGKSGKSGWFIGWREPFEYMIAGDWRTGERFELAEKNSQSLSADEKKKREILLREAQEKSTAEREERREAARLKADIMFRSGVNGGYAVHDYLDRKKIGAYGVRVLDNELLIPCHDCDGNLWGLQRILVDGKKFFLTGQRFDSTFHKIHGKTDRIYICEGYATGASIHMATGALVYCAFSAGNLPKVAELVRMMHADGQIIVAGDDDRWSEGNAGRVAALKAAELAAARAVFPAFKSDDGEPTDFNDLHCREGLEIVAEVLRMADVVTSGPNNVVPIEGGRKKKGRPKGSLGDKPKPGELFRQVVDGILGAEHMPPFPFRYIALEPERGLRVPAIVEADESVEIVRVQTLATHVAQYCHGQLDSRFAIKPSEAKEIANLFLALAEPTSGEAVKIVRWRDEPGLTYRRLPWDKGDGLAPAPTWDKLLSRMSNAQAFIEWTGSLFFAESNLQQYVLMFGLGGDGKGSINRFNFKVFGKSYRSKQPPAKGDKFWTHGILGARLVAFPDCEDSGFVGGGLFKSLTGGDPIDVEAKGEMSFTARFFAKYMVIVNDRPVISSQKSNLRRIIFCELAATDEDDPTFEDRLWDEGGAFLSACVAAYASKYPNHGLIATDDEEIREWTEELEAHYHEAFREWFRIDEKDHVVPGHMLKLTQDRWKDRKTQLGFIRFIERTHGVKKRTIHKLDGSPKGYVGISALTAPFASPARWND